MALYLAYSGHIWHGDWGIMPTVAAEPIGRLLLHVGGISLGLLAITFVLSTCCGLLLGVAGIHHHPPRVARWFTPLTTIGLATPSFYLGTVVIALLLFYFVRSGPDADLILPLQGFGWDRHLLLPTLALVVRPTAQLAQATATLLVTELELLYITAARGRGMNRRRIAWRHALRVAWAPLVMTIAASLRLLTGELLLVEKLFGWPGLGRLLASALVPPTTATLGRLDGAASYFLYPPLVAGALTAFALLFLLVDLVAVLLAHRLDPRLLSVTAVDHG
ncbi:MAG: ABC transporter permease [Caldilineaceae bacterium]